VAAAWERAFEARAWARGYAKYRLGHSGSQNVYFATLQRSGSQWVKAIFDDPRIRRHTGLVTYPQHDYDDGDFHRRFPLFTFVPGLYVPYELYELIEKPSRFRTFYLIRDTRNVVVSWYWSTLKTHPLVPVLARHRRQLQALSRQDGISYSIRALARKLHYARTWIYNADDPQLLIVRFEDLVQDPVSGFTRIFEHCGLAVPQAMLQLVLDDYSKDKMRQRDLAQRADKSESHYRFVSSDYQSDFTAAHDALFHDVAGDLLQLLGYSQRRG
jgi:hypothetical protein